MTETTVARKYVEDAEAAGQQEQETTKKAEHARLTNREAKKKFQYIVVAIGDSMSDIARSNDGDDRQEEVDE